VTEQIGLSDFGGVSFDPESSRFIQTTWALDVKRLLPLSSLGARVRFLDSAEAARIGEQVHRRNVFSRHSYERGFYFERIAEFANRSVIEVELPGDPKTVVARARTVADVVETACCASTCLYLSRRSFHGRMGVTRFRKDTLDFTIGPSFRHLSASSRREAVVHGIRIDKTFVGRFTRSGLERAVALALVSSAIGRRVNQALSWLRESRFEESYSAAVVKLAIGFEALLGGNEIEPLRRSISERCAFLLSDDAEVRSEISTLVKRFYDTRSEVVHGSTRKKSKPASTEQLEAADRLLLLMVVVIANNEVFQPDAGVQEWVERQRWGANATIIRPFRPGDLTRALFRALPRD
jgi:hypothetical protein